MYKCSNLQIVNLPLDIIEIIAAYTVQTSISEYPIFKHTCNKRGSTICSHRTRNHKTSCHCFNKFIKTHHIKCITPYKLYA